MNVGDLVLVRYGFWDATQVAAVVAPTSGKGPKVQKWLDSSRRWGKPVRIAAGEVLGPAPADDPRAKRARASIGP